MSGKIGLQVDLISAGCAKQIKFRFLNLFYIKYKNLGISNLKGRKKVTNMYPTLFQIKCPSKESPYICRIVVVVLVRKGKEEKSNLLTNTIMTREAAM